MNEIDPDQTLRRTVNVTEFRRHMAHYIAAVRYGDDWLRIRRKGTDPVYLVSEFDFRLICEKADELHSGPRDPETGARSGRGFMHWVRQALKADRKAAEAGPAAVAVEPMTARPEPCASFDERMAAARERMRAKKATMEDDGVSHEERRAQIMGMIASAEARVAEIEAERAAGEE